jgi:DNA-binding PadR family transcriptional regulator
MSAESLLWALILIYLADGADQEHRASVFNGDEYLRLWTGLDDGRVVSALHDLEDRGLLKVEYPGDAGFVVVGVSMIATLDVQADELIGERS